MAIKTFLKIVVAGLLAVAVIAAGVAFIGPRLLDLDSRKGQIISLAEKALNRRVSYETASLSWHFAPAIAFRGVIIAEKSGDAAFLKAERVSFKIALLPLLRKEVRLREVDVERPVLLVNRDQNGVFNFHDLLTAKSSGSEVHLQSVRIQNGQVRFTDRLVDPKGFITTLEKLDLYFSSLEKGETAEVRFSSLIADGSGHGQLSASGTARMPAEKESLSDAKFDMRLSLKNLDVGRYWPYYGRYLPCEPLRGRLDSEQVFTGKLSEFKTKGQFNAKELSLDYPAVFHALLAPRELSIAYEVERSPGKLDIKSFDLNVDGLHVTGNCALDDLHSQDPYIKARAAIAPFSLEAFQNYIPYGVIPAGTADFIKQHIKGGTFRVNEGRLDGRISQLAHMDQGTNYNALFIRASVDKGVMTFGPQVPTISAIKGGLEFCGKDFILSGLTGRFGGSPFSLEGKIADYPIATPASYPFTMVITPGEAEVAWLFRQDKASGMVFSGPSPLRLTGSGIAANYQLSGSWDLSRADYRFAQLIRKPAGLTNRLSFSAILGSTEARLTELHYQLPPLDVTANAVYRYDDKLPLSLAVATNQFEVSNVRSVFPALASYHPLGRLQAAVSAVGNPAASDSFKWQGGVTLAELSLHPLAQIPPVNHLNGTVNVSGTGVATQQLTGKLGSSDFTVKGSLNGFANPAVEAAITSPGLHLSDLGLRSPGLDPLLENLAAKIALQDGNLTISSLTGEVNRTSFELQGDLRDFRNPKINLRVKFPFIRVEDMQMFAGLQPAGESGTKPGNSALKVQIEVDAGTVREIPFTKLAAELSLQNSHLDVQTVSLGIFGGTVSGSGTAELDSDGGPAYQAKYRLERVDAAQLLKTAGSEPSVTGLLTAAGEVTMRGSSAVELKKSAAVTTRLHLQDGTINNPGKTGEKIPYSVIDADLAFNKGNLTVQGLNASLFGGTVSGSGTAELDSVGGPAYQAHYRLDRVDAAQLLKAAGLEPTVTGVLTATGELTVRGNSPEELKKSARLTGEIELNSGRLVIAPTAGVEKRHEIPFKAFQGRFSFEKSQLTAQAVRIDIFDGTVFAHGAADFTAPHDPAYQVSLQVKSIDAAGVDEAFGFTSDISGRLNFEGELAARGDNPDALRKSVQGSFEIHFEKGVINKFGFVSKVFSILNVSQLFALRLPDLVSVGMPYNSIDGSFSVKDGSFLTSDLALDSSSINFTVVGKTDIVKQEIDLLCAVQPLQTLSMIISRIPVIGWLLTGGDKHFLVSYYEAKGSWNDPTVTGRNIASLPGGVYNIFKRVYNLPENLFTNTGEVLMGN